MDEAVIALWPLKEGLFTAYDRSLRQRNRLLKEWEGSGTPPGMEAWDEELIQAGSAVIRARAEAIERLAPHASEEFVHLAGYELACTYAPNVWDADRPGAGLPRSHRGASPRRAAAAHLAGRAAPRRPHAGRARSRREGRGVARRDVGHGAVSARRPRHRGHRRSSGSRRCSWWTTRSARSIPRAAIRSASTSPRARARCSSRWPTRPTSLRSAHAVWDVHAGTVTPRSA